MSEVPKIVHDRLRAASAGGAHPDTNVLTAFAEQSLATAEREGVLAHLAACEECREVLAFSHARQEAGSNVAAVEQARTGVPRERTVSSARPAWFAWNRLGWAGLAAGIAIAAGVLLLNRVKPKVEEALQSPTTGAPAAAPTEANKVASPPTSEIATTAESRAAAPVAAPTPLHRRDELKKLAEPTILLNKEAAAQNVPQAPSARKDVGADLAFGISAGAPASTTETVEVTGAAPLVAAKAKPVQVEGGNEAAPVMRAKSARAFDASLAGAKKTPAETTQVEDQQTVAKQESTEIPKQEGSITSESRVLPLEGRNAYELPQPPQSPIQWMVRGDKVQRSSDSGVHWKTVFRPHRPLLCVGSGTSDVWAGGKNGVLFHSANSGETWDQMHPAFNGQSLADDITHIYVQSTTRVVLFTSKNESWSTNDGGNTWEKK